MDSDFDYQPMESFGLKWRWEPGRSTIAPEELLRIRPLSSARSEEAWKRSSKFGDGRNHNFRPSSDLFATIREIRIGDRGDEEVRDWLYECMKQEGEPIVVCWQPDLAAVTDWDIFVRFWDDFCYPASDDVAIWPRSEKWVLHYWHEGAFYFAA